MRVIVTRPQPQADAWVSGFRAAGLDAVALPLITLDGPPDPQALQAAWQQAAPCHALMFVSAHAVAQFFAWRPEGAPVPPTARWRCWATGPGTVAALHHVGIPAETIDAPHPGAAQFDSEALWQRVQAGLHPGQRVLIVRGDTKGGSGDAALGVGRDWLAGRLAERGVQVAWVVAYVRRAPPLRAEALALLQQSATDGSVWLFSSSEAVRNLHALAAAQSWQRARAVATHARIAQAARAAGFAQVHTARPTLTELIASIESLA